MSSEIKRFLNVIPRNPNTNNTTTTKTFRNQQRAGNKTFDKTLCGIENTITSKQL
jgi:hypothetical protein